MMLQPEIATNESISKLCTQNLKRHNTILAINKLEV